jgi:Xaa-Pro aminopeptidase
MRPRLLTALLAASMAATSAAAAQAPSPPRDAWRIDDLPPGAPVSAAEHAARRAALAAAMEDGVLLVFGESEPAQELLPFVQSPAFRYLTGITEPGAALAIARRGGAVREVLFVRRRNPAREVWDGVRLGAARAAERTGIAARDAEEMDAVVDSLLAGGGALYTVTRPEAGGSRRPLSAGEQRVLAVARRHPALPRLSLGSTLGTLRGRKSARELDLIHRAVLVTLAAQREAMRAVEPGMNEFEIQALIEATFRRHGADGPSFGSIVGSGPNATTLHYRSADRFMAAGEVVVLDVGASYRGYAADVTRTLPVAGRFSADQRAVYGIVLEAQKAAERQVRVGAGWAEASAAADRVLAAGLARLGLIDAPDATYECRPGGTCRQLQLFYMHGLGHGIGLDVHDPDVSFGGGFQVGSAFTLEPGIYVRADVLDHLPDTPANRALRERRGPAVARYAGIGVRIEDDYVLTAGGLVRLSAGAPREADEVEALMAEPSAWNAARHAEAVEWYRETTP